MKGLGSRAENKGDMHIDHQTVDGIRRRTTRARVPAPHDEASAFSVRPSSRVRPLRRAWYRGALNAAVYLVIVGGIVLGVPKLLSATLHTPYPMAAITSGSMWPALKEGNLVFIHGDIKKEDIKVGDIIVYRNQQNGTFTIHRVTKLKPTTLITRGDANLKDDAPVAYEDVVGRALTFSGKPVHIPYLGAITVFASNLRPQ